MLRIEIDFIDRYDSPNGKVYFLFVHLDGKIYANQEISFLIGMNYEKIVYEYNGFAEDESGVGDFDYYYDYKRDAEMAARTVKQLIKQKYAI
jgi:hypothetical protein